MKISIKPIELVTSTLTFDIFVPKIKFLLVWTFIIFQGKFIIREEVISSKIGCSKIRSRKYGNIKGGKGSQQFLIFVWLLEKPILTLVNQHKKLLRPYFHPLSFPGPPIDLVVGLGWTFEKNYFLKSQFSISLLCLIIAQSSNKNVIRLLWWLECWMKFLRKISAQRIIWNINQVVWHIWLNKKLIIFE